MNSELPQGWAAVALDELLLPGGLFDGPFGSNLKTSDYVETGVRVVRLENLGHLQFIAGKRTFISYRKYSSLIKHRVCEGDIIFGSFVDGNVRVCILPPLDTLAIAKADCFCIRSHEDLVDRRFLVYYLATPRVRDALIDQIHGATRPRINTRQLRQLDVLLPPFDEQQRIARRLFEVLSKVQTSRARLENIPQVLKRFRQAVLAAACSGRLTADWRAKHPAPHPLNHMITAIQQRRLKAASTEAQREKIAEIYSHPEEGEQETLPSGWEFVRLAKLADSFDYGTSAKSNPTGAAPVLRMGNLQNGEIDWTNLAFTSDEREINDYTLQPNTVLFNRTNSPELVGKTAIYRGERRAIFAGYLIRVRVVPELDPEYLNLCLNTTYAREFCAQVKTDGVSQSNINAQKLGAFEVPYCPIHEQREIVRRVQALDAVSDKIEARYAKATAYVNKITQSILAKASRGELVPTEARLAMLEGREYETAMQLLQRIKKAPIGKRTTRGRDRHSVHTRI